MIKQISELRRDQRTVLKTHNDLNSVLSSLTMLDRSYWPSGLRRGSAASRLLGLWVRIPPGHGWMSVVGVVFCQAEASASG
jgi:hypothetical protein